ncbi:MAG: MGH1-like glycoside hydrolase domain-containing protein [Acidimicrobiales bacterium]
MTVPPDDPRTRDESLPDSSTIRREFDEVRARVRAIMDAHWQPEGFTVPHDTVYPFRWLWDSCFHALVWMALGEPDRAVAELTFTLSVQEPDGFVPHIHYVADPGRHADFWGRAGTSTIAQPPMFGHAVAELVRVGVDVPAELVDRADRGLAWWFRARRHASGLIAAHHPWETGCDDSPRFDHWGAANPARWYEAKGELVREPFDCAAVGLTALVAWNQRELAATHGGFEPADELAAALAGRWDPRRRTWVDAGSSAISSGRTRTLEALLPLLVEERAEVRRAALGELADPEAFAGRYGPRGTHAAEPAYDPTRYWRGGVWPQLAYLLWRAGADDVAEPTVAGALSSGFAEWWHPDTGEGLGAVPQSWTGLVLLTGM